MPSLEPEFPPTVSGQLETAEIRACTERLVARSRCHTIGLLAKSVMTHPIIKETGRDARPAGRLTHPAAGGAQQEGEVGPLEGLGDLAFGFGQRLVEPVRIEVAVRSRHRLQRAPILEPRRAGDATR